MTDSMNDLRQASADVSGVEVLSPAAQAVRKAYYSTDDDLAGPALAAALRVAASQLTSAKASNQLRAIAAELEGASG